MSQPKAIVEIGVEVTNDELLLLEKLLHANNIPFYIEPQTKVPFVSIEELEIACEGK